MSPKQYRQKGPAKRASKPTAKQPSSVPPLSKDPLSLDGARQHSMPTKPQAELASLVREPPDGTEWLHEIKFDGYRMFCLVKQGKARLLSRRGQDWTLRFAPVAEAAARLSVDTAILDGEVVVLDSQGVSQFQLLQNALGKGGQPSKTAALLYYAFDLIYLDGFDLCGVNIEDRKGRLEALLEESRVAPRIQFSEHVVGRGKQFFKQACRSQLEGIISKRRDSLYHPGRGADWLKSKCRRTEEFVIGGYTRPEGTRIGFGALLLGYHRKNGDLVYAGRVGTGFSDRFLREFAARLKEREQLQSPFAKGGPEIPPKGVRWVRPDLVGQVEFSNWTDDGILRQAAFQGLREDKAAGDVVLEVPIEAPGND